jgi:hypothetical protein
MIASPYAIPENFPEPGADAAMKHRRQVLLLCLALIASVPVFAQEVGTLHLRPLHLEFPSTWRFDGSRNPIEGFGPEGEKALVTIIRGKPRNGPEPGPSTQELAQSFAQGPMAQLASKGGKALVRPVSGLPAPEGKFIYSAGSETSGWVGAKSYFVQYAMAAPGALIYITFEGKGDAAGALQRFDGIIATQKWDD